MTTKIHPDHLEINIVENPNPITVQLGSIYDTNHTFCIKLKFFYDRYKKLIMFLGIIVFILIIIAILSLTNLSSSVGNPCILYTDSDLAQDVSMGCFNHMWRNTCKGNIPGDFNGGWWLRSPEGGKTVPCYPKNVGKCGAGNFGTIRTNIFRCNLYYEGL